MNLQMNRVKNDYFLKPISPKIESSVSNVSFRLPKSPSKKESTMGFRAFLPRRKHITLSEVERLK